jgi:hypothetical protein
MEGGTSHVVTTPAAVGSCVEEALLQQQAGDTAAARNGSQPSRGASVLDAEYDPTDGDADTAHVDVVDDGVVEEEEDQQQQQQPTRASRKTKATKKEYNALVTTLHNNISTARQIVRRDDSLGASKRKPGDSWKRAALAFTDTGCGGSKSVRMSTAGALEGLGAARLARLQRYLYHLQHPTNVYARSQARMYLDAVPLSEEEQGKVPPAAVVIVLSMLKDKELLPAEEVTRILKALVDKETDPLQLALAEQAIADAKVVSAYRAEGVKQLNKRAREQMLAAREPDAARRVGSQALELATAGLPGVNAWAD